MWMNNFLRGGSLQVPILSPSTWSVNLAPFLEIPDEAPGVQVFQLRSLYALRMMNRQVITPESWEPLRTMRSDWRK